MKILVIDNGSTYISSLQKLLLGHDVKVMKYKEIMSSDQGKQDLIILSGGHSFSVVGHAIEYANELAFIKETTTPILGICLGFELIAYAYDSYMQIMSAKEKSIIEIMPLIPDPIFTNINSISIFESHRWIVGSLGSQLQALANSKDGIEIFRHKEKLIYGFQFHPEMFPLQTQGDEIFANFIKLVQNRLV